MKKKPKSSSRRGLTKPGKISKDPLVSAERLADVLKVYADDMKFHENTLIENKKYDPLWPEDQY